jgi:hypothetical protein
MNDPEVHWSPRVPREKLRRLYESEARGIIDEELLEDVGLTLLLRCEDILAIEQAREGRVSCPRCRRRQSRVVIQRKAVSSDDPEGELLTCPACGWQMTWGAFAHSYHRKQLNAGGATRFFAAYIQAYREARTAVERMLAIDRLIHEFHYSAKVRPDQPTRPAGVNLIEGSLASVITFLDELGRLTPGLPGVASTRDQWRDSLQKFQQVDWIGIVAEERTRRS